MTCRKELAVGGFDIALQGRRKQRRCDDPAADFGACARERFYVIDIELCRAQASMRGRSC